MTLRATEPSAGIMAALIAAQAEFPAIKKDSQGYGYRYADLAGVCGVIYPILHKHGLAVVQTFAGGPDQGHLEVTTTLIHDTGQTLQGSICMPLPDKCDAQKVGTAATYGRRYGMSALLGIVTEEDTDAAELKDAPRANRKPAPKYEPGRVPADLEAIQAVGAIILSAAKAAGVEPGALLADITGGRFSSLRAVTYADELEDIEAAFNDAARRRMEEKKRA